MKDILTVGIVGLGLIGGSIAHALKRTGGRYRTAAWNRDSEILDKALSDGVVDISVSPDLAEFQFCDIIFLCVPVYAMKDLLERIKPHIRPDCVITDVGSTKGDVYRIMAEMGVSGQFIGGHPWPDRKNRAIRLPRPTFSRTLSM